jgi:hypothetical protein
LAIGFTIIFAVTTPVFHAKLLAPLAARLVDAPAHIAISEELITITGKLFTVTVSDAVPWHPFVPVPVTVKEVVTFGPVVMLAVLAPVLHR